MFTGIVEELGRVREPAPSLVIEAQRVLEDARIGSSIAVDGCCLTVTAVGDGWWAADVVAQTLATTTLGDRRAGDPVNLERPVRVFDRLGGHLVQGHVDACGGIRARVPQSDGSELVTFDVSETIERYLVPKGSIAIDGVSLTVAEVAAGAVTVALVPHTLAATTLGSKPVGERVNLEGDLIAKYVERLTTGGSEASSDMARQAGRA